MRLVIADTSPINYNLLIGHIDLLQTLFNKVILPAAVSAELAHPKAPPVVRDWIAAPPAWVDIRQTLASRQSNPPIIGLDAGEEDAIALALELRADLVLMDDEDGAAVARAKGLEVTGTLGILKRAGQRRLLDLADAFNRIKRTNFRYRQDVMDGLLLERQGRTRGKSKKPTAARHSSGFGDLIRLLLQSVAAIHRPQARGDRVQAHEFRVLPASDLEQSPSPNLRITEDHFTSQTEGPNIQYCGRRRSWSYEPDRAYSRRSR